MNLIYGPVKSLRYGTTLGVNLLGATKVCSYNCGYCSLGASELTMNKIRKEYQFPTLDAIKTEFRQYIRNSVTTDYIVVSGNGEPTLHPQFDEVMVMLVELRAEHLQGVPIVVLSNGAHLDSKRLVQGMNLADERVIIVDAGNDGLLQKVNEPLVRINIAKFLNGIGRLKDCVVQAHFCRGKVDNTTNEAVDEWIEIVGMMKPKKVQLCTLSRAPWVEGLLSVDEDVLDSIAFRLKKRTGLESSVFPANKA